MHVPGWCQREEVAGASAFLVSDNVFKAKTLARQKRHFLAASGRDERHCRVFARLVFLAALIACQTAHSESRHAIGFRVQKFEFISNSVDEIIEFSAHSEDHSHHH